MIVELTLEKIVARAAERYLEMLPEIPFPAELEQFREVMDESLRATFVQGYIEGINEYCYRLHRLWEAGYVQFGNVSGKERVEIPLERADGAVPPPLGWESRDVL